MGKIISLADAAAAVQRLRWAPTESIVLCSGTFDPVHPGHIKHLQAARLMGSAVFVAVASDSQVHLRKGPGRPVFPERLRAECLAALECVYAVIINNEPSAVALIERLKPDIYCKGQEYRDRQTPGITAERQAVADTGGRMEYTNEVVYSATELIHHKLYDPGFEQVYRRAITAWADIGDILIAVAKSNKMGGASMFWAKVEEWIGNRQPRV